MDHQYQMLEEWFRENETSCPHCESFACARENTQQHDSSVINTRKMQKINATLDKSKYCDIHKLIITMQKQCVTFFLGGGGDSVYGLRGLGSIPPHHLHGVVYQTSKLSFELYSKVSILC